MRFTKSPFSLHFRVKFYVTEMGRLFEEYTRYHFYLQIRKDILDGRLTGPETIMTLLGSYVLQSELGDYSPEEHSNNYCSDFCFVPNQTEEFEKKVISLHRMHSGQTPADAELNYLEEAKKLEFYGVDLHQARDAESNDIQIGVSGSGLTVFRNLVKLNTFSWAKIVKISFKRRFFFIQLKHEGVSFVIVFVFCFDFLITAFFFDRLNVLTMLLVSISAHIVHANHCGKVALNNIRFFVYTHQNH